MDVTGYREGVEESLDSLDRWLDGLIHEVNHATETSIELLDGLRVVVARIRERLPAVEAEFKEEGLDPSQPAIRIGHVLNGLHQVIFTIGETAKARTPAALADSLKAVARRYVDAEVVLLFRPGQRGLEYTFTPFGTQVLKFLAGAEAVVGAQLCDALNVDGKKIVLLSYPASEQNNVLLHSIFLHEIGHFITDVHTVPRKAFDAFFAASVNLPPEFAGKPADAVLAMQEILRRWLWELAADASAVRLLGPAYLFGIYRSMLVGEALEQYSREHPPAWLRLGMMLDQLRGAGYFGVEVLAPALAEWESRLAAAETRFREQLPTAKLIVFAGEPQDQALFVMTEQLLPFVVAEVEKALRGEEYTAEHYRRECPRLVEQLNQFIPSNEWFEEETGTWQTSTLAGILNAGWTYVITGLEEAFSNVGAETDDEKREFRRRIFALIAKSIELAQIQGDVAEARLQLAS